MAKAREVHELRTDLNIILVRTTLNGAGKTPLRGGGGAGAGESGWTLQNEIQPIFSFWDFQVLLLLLLFFFLNTISAQPKKYILLTTGLIATLASQLHKGK